MKRIILTCITVFTVLAFMACSSGTTSGSDLTLVVGEDVEMEGIIVAAAPQLEGEEEPSHYVDLIKKDKEGTIINNQLISKGKTLKVKNLVYTCTSVSENKLEFTLNK